ncbi:Mitochondrial fission 1 protein A [Capsicum annuum]|uniref:Mitochondrial fission 1 protein n=1 Tax=Capsicum annuum TaxID=4072 RepID=A0A1U8FGY9_CAPAN|nr:mitochondrial fission 1 protein A-like [Capsicum annuum]KAF3669943.1 Mitochondrial fission 1 protein A [Capsicum annuum]KAF3682399.1 Mitochondrial fission 1 protein A [Capsicum annuum]PHT91839.1 Mitochondrial fission 1 protein A [Capsicum annuum]
MHIDRAVRDATTGTSDEGKNESIMRLSWALVHSKQPQDVQRGIAMLQASLANSSSPLQQREKLYLLAVGFYRSREYSRSRELTDQCLEIAPDWRQALSLKKAIENRITKDGVIGIGITLITIGFIAGGIVASLVRRK